MSGYGVNQPPNRLTVPTSGHPTMVTQTTVMLPVQHKQWVVHVINPQHVVGHMVHVSPGYAPFIPLYTQQAAVVLPQNGAYRSAMYQWQPQATMASPLPARAASSSEPVQDSHYNYLRHTHHDRLDSLRTQDWQYVAHILKPEMERCGLSLPNEKAAMDILLQLREAQNIDSFEQLESALLEWLSNEETQVKHAPDNDMSPEYACDDTLVREYEPDDVRSLHDSAISESGESESLSEYPEVRDRKVTSDYGSASDVGSYPDHDHAHDPDLPLGDLPAYAAHQDQCAPQQQPTKTGKRKRFSPKAFFGRLAKWFGKGKKKGNVTPEAEKARVDHSVLSEQDQRRDGFSGASLPPACERLQYLGEDVEIRWNFLTIAADEHRQFISLLDKKNTDEADPQAWLDRVLKRTGLTSMEAIQERKQDVVTGLRKAVGDLAVALDEYRRQETVVLRESDNYDENSQESLSIIQNRTSSIEPRLEKVQKAINKMR